MICGRSSDNTKGGHKGEKNVQSGTAIIERSAIEQNGD
jgi:hypothetical protein